MSLILDGTGKLSAHSALQQELRKFAIAKQYELEYCLGELMACKPLSEWRHLTKQERRDDRRRVQVETWFYFEVPIMRCTTEMRPDMQIIFEIEDLWNRKEAKE